VDIGQYMPISVKHLANFDFMAERFTVLIFPVVNLAETKTWEKQ